MAITSRFYFLPLRTPLFAASDYSLIMQSIWSKPFIPRNIVTHIDINLASHHRHSYTSSFSKSELIKPAAPTIRSVWMMVSDLREGDAEEVLEEVTGRSGFDSWKITPSPIRAALGSHGFAKA
jgi:hypothetical protein